MPPVSSGLSGSAAGGDHRRGGRLPDRLAVGSAQRRVRRHLLALGHGQLDARPPPGHEPRHLLVHGLRPLLDHPRVGLRRPPGRIGPPHRPGGLLAPVGRPGVAHGDRRRHPLPAARGRLDLDRSALRGDRGGRHALPGRPAPDGELPLPGPAACCFCPWPGAGGAGSTPSPSSSFCGPTCTAASFWASASSFLEVIAAVVGIRLGPGARARSPGRQAGARHPGRLGAWPRSSIPSGPGSTRARWG